MTGPQAGGDERVAPAIDRRKALQKAAVAGAVAWSAPLILSETAHAQPGVCTPKCRPAGTPALGAATANVTCDAVS